MNEPICPICSSYVGWQGHRIHKYGKYLVVYYTYNDEERTNVEDIRTSITDYRTYMGRIKLRLDGFVVLNEERIERFLLLQ